MKSAPNEWLTLQKMIESCLRRKSKFIKIKNRESLYTINELHIPAKLFSLKAIDEKMNYQIKSIIILITKY